MDSTYFIHLYNWIKYQFFLENNMHWNMLSHHEQSVGHICINHKNLIILCWFGAKKNQQQKPLEKWE